MSNCLHCTQDPVLRVDEEEERAHEHGVNNPGVDRRPALFRGRFIERVITTCPRLHRGRPMRHGCLEETTHQPKRNNISLTTGVI